MSSKEKVTQPITLNPNPDEEDDVSRPNNTVTYDFDPWDFLGSDMYTYQKLVTNLNAMNNSLTMQTGTRQIPHVVSKLISHEQRADITAEESFFDFPRGQVAQYAQQIYGTPQALLSSDGLTSKVFEHENAYKFVSHLLFTNIFFNFKELFFLVDSSGTRPSDWSWAPVSAQTISALKNSPNKYLIMKLDLSEHTKGILQQLGFDISKSGFASHHNHAAPQTQYFIFSSDAITDTQYYQIEPDTRTGEPVVSHNQAFLDSIDNYPLSNDGEDSTFSYTNSMLSPELSYSYKNKEPNSDIFIEVDNGEPYVQR